MISFKNFIQGLAILSIILIFSQCDRLDTTSPVIKLVGENIVRIHLGDAYTEQGAIAVDDFDGDISDAIFIDNSQVMVDSIGTYAVDYSAVDDSDNRTDLVRIVHIYGDASDYVGTYNVSSVCDTASNNYSVEIIEGINNEVIFNNLLNDTTEIFALITGETGATFFVEDSITNISGMLIEGTGSTGNFEFQFNTNNTLDSIACEIILVP